jgi:rhodanese-related sulfurtransferase
VALRMVDNLGPRQVNERLRREDPPLLVDVREPWERHAAAIPDSHHVPLGELPFRLDELPRDRDLVIVCHHGNRSLQAAWWLAGQGYDRLANLDGGIDGWSREVAPDIPRYQ